VTGAAPGAAFAGGAGATFEARLAALLAALTPSEKIAQLETEAPAVRRVGLPAYGWWNEALHGLARQGEATVFPQAIGLAATFDPGLLEEIGRAIAAEARLKDRLRGAGDPSSGDDRDRGVDEGLTFFAPNVNLDRDPRWGRGQETYGEDPWLVGRLATAFVRGIQGDDPSHLAAAATAKHFAVHSGPEALRHGFDARPTAEDLEDSYLPAFEAVVREAHVAMVMAAYNAIDGAPVVSSPYWLGEVLRRRWGFDGAIVGDCGAVGDLVGFHHAAPDAAAAAASALLAGVDLDCGRTFGALGQALARGLVATSDLDRALGRLLRLRDRLGLLGPAWSGQSLRDATTPAGSSRGDLARAFSSLLDEHRDLALRAARASLVWLEPPRVAEARCDEAAATLGSAARCAPRARSVVTSLDALPVGSRVLVVGPNADDRQVLLGSYHGEPRQAVTIWEGVARFARRRGLVASYAAGSGATRASPGQLARAVAAARASDAIVAVLGLSPRLEGEEGDPESENPAGDRADLALPSAQRTLLRFLGSTGRPVFLVLTGGGAIAYPRVPNLAAVLMAWYPGQEGGRAVAEALFGEGGATGRLPVTFYGDVADLPPFPDYRMAGRTYRFVRRPVLWPFGHGGRNHAVLLEGRSEDRVLVTTWENRGRATADVLAEAYVTAVGPAGAPLPSPDLPLTSLVGIARGSLAPGARAEIRIEVDAAAEARFVARIRRHRADAVFAFLVGPHAPDARAVASSAADARAGFAFIRP
jgi:beta-glucosidase